MPPSLLNLTCLLLLLFLFLPFILIVYNGASPQSSICHHCLVFLLYIFMYSSKTIGMSLRYLVILHIDIRGRAGSTPLTLYSDFGGADIPLYAVDRTHRAAALT